MKINKIAVIGSGLMGHGIAQVAAMTGHEVSLIDISDELLQKALQKMSDSLSKLSDKGKLHENPGSVLKRIRTSTDLFRGVSDSDYIIEAVLEDINLKKKIFVELDAHAPQHAILATNTSGLSVTVLAEATKRKEKVIGMHWTNPPQIMKLVEIIKSKYTSDETLQGTLDLCRRYNKETIVAKRDIWFFLTARARAGFSIQACLMYLNKEADFKEIDAVARYKLGLPMGEFELSDFIGIVDIRTRGLKSAEQILKIYPDFEPWPVFLAAYRYLADALWSPMSEKGLSGIKTGRGFYSYPEGKYTKPEISKDLARNIDPIDLLAPSINVAAWCVSNGVGSIADVNKSFKLGFGWPKGIFEFVDELGSGDIMDVLKKKEDQAPAWLKGLYRPDPLLTKWDSRTEMLHG